VHQQYRTDIAALCARLDYNGYYTKTLGLLSAV
jgi:hypothetical protein